MNWLKNAWNWLGDSKHRKILAFIGAGLVVIVSAGWQLYQHFSKPEPHTAGSPSVSAMQGSISAGHDVTASASPSGTAIVATGTVNVSNVRPEDMSEIIARANARARESRDYLHKGDRVNAELLLKESLAILEKGLGPDNPNVARSLRSLGWFYYQHDVQHRDKAEPLFKQALAIEEKALGSDHPEVSGFLGALAQVYRDQGRYTEAEPLYQRALAIEEKARGQDSDDSAVIESRELLAELYRSQGKYAEAEALYEHSVAVLSKKRTSPTDTEPAVTLHKLANVYRNHGRYAEAEQTYKRALAIYKEHGRDETSHFVSALEDYAILLRKVDRAPEATALESRAKMIR
jgi:tetratricopeptide (TPR) repeat protein